jgi:hypothetical protein
MIPPDQLIKILFPQQWPEQHITVQVEQVFVIGQDGRAEVEHEVVFINCGSVEDIVECVGFGCLDEVADGVPVTSAV